MYDPYKILGVSPDATEEEIRSAYMALARQNHPDLNPDDKAAGRRMNDINTAYDALRDPKLLESLQRQHKGGKGGAKAAAPGKKDGPNEAYNKYVQRVYGIMFVACIAVTFLIWFIMKTFHLGPFSL